MDPRFESQPIAHEEMLKSQCSVLDDNIVDLFSFSIEPHETPLGWA
jgi:hypothetical protein